jgi:hypothetical protein
MIVKTRSTYGPPGESEAILRNGLHTLNRISNLVISGECAVQVFGKAPQEWVEPEACRPHAIIQASTVLKFVVKACISASFEGLPKTKVYLELVLVGIGLVVSMNPTKQLGKAHS